MSSAGQIAAVARLDFAEVLRSRWAFFCFAVYGVLAAVFVLVGMRESSVMGFTGIGRVLLSFTHALVLLLPLLGLTATGQVINSAREDGGLELLFSQPLSRTCYFVAVTLVRLGVLVVPLLALMFLMALIGRFWFGQVVPWGFLARAMLVSCSLLVASVSAGLLVSTIVRNQAKALMILLLIWACGCALLDFALAGLMLQWQLQPQVVFLLAALNPVQDARLALLSAADPELANLGPVGFYLANYVGAFGLLLIGIGWPLLLGGSAWTLALYQLRRRDLVLARITRIQEKARNMTTEKTPASLPRERPPRSFFEFLDVPLGMRTRVLLVLLVSALVLSFVFPLWRISMVAPQYPDGLYLDIYSYKLDAGNDGHDLTEINVLNHYIGMRNITRDELRDLDWLPFGIGALIVLCLRVAVLGNIRTLVDYSMVSGYILTFAFFRFVYMLYDFGHSLDPKAPMNIEAFTPAILGTKKIANFTTHSYPLLGSIMLMVFIGAVWLLTIRQLFLGRSRAKAWFASHSTG